MKTDLYTKIVLTIIAICFVWTVSAPVMFPEVQAGSGITRVDIVKIGGHYLPNNGRYVRLPVLTANETIGGR